VKFLKVLFNSLLTGLFFSALIGLLIYDINFNLSVSSTGFFQLLLFLFITYGLVIAVLSVAFFFILQFFLGRPFRIAFVSPSFLSMSFSLVTGIFLLLFTANRDYFRSFFSPEVKGLLQNQSTPLLFLALLGLLCFYGYHRYRKHFLFLVVYFVFFSAAVFYIFQQRLHFPEPPKPEKVANLEAKRIDKKVTIITLEGMSFDVLIPLINEGKLPNFSWLMEEGSWGKLACFTPTDPFILNSSFRSGKLPAKHRRLSRFRYSFWRGTENLEVVPRFMFFGQLLKTGLLVRFPTDVFPEAKDIWSILEDNGATFLVEDRLPSGKVPPVSPKAETRFNLVFKDLEFDTSQVFDRVRKAFYTDFVLEERVFEEKEKNQPQIVCFHLEGLNIVSKFFYRYSFPELFGNIDQDLINRYGTVIERYYQFYDDIIGKVLVSLKEEELLIVFSTHGVEPLPLWKRVVEWLLGNADVSAYHELAPDGVVFFFGKNIVRGRNIDRIHLIDIAPTLLNYLGLPVGKDMDGIVVSSVFSEDFKMENPVLYISSYEEHAIKLPD